MQSDDKPISFFQQIHDIACFGCPYDDAHITHALTHIPHNIYNSDSTHPHTIMPKHFTSAGYRSSIEMLGGSSGLSPPPPPAAAADAIVVNSKWRNSRSVDAAVIRPLPLLRLAAIGCRMVDSIPLAASDTGMLVYVLGSTRACDNGFAYCPFASIELPRVVLPFFAQN